MTEPVWFPKARESLYPRHGAKRRLPKVDPAKVVGALRWSLAQRGSRIRAGLESCSPEMRALTERALTHADEIAADASRLAGTLDPVLVGTAMRLLSVGLPDDPMRVAMAPALMAKGLDFALKALAQSLSLRVDWVGQYSIQTMNTLPLRASVAAPELVSFNLLCERAEWENLRGLVAAASDVERKAVRDVAASLRADANVTLPLRCALAFVLPEEPAWAAEDARAFMVRLDGEPKVDAYGVLLFASLDDTDVALELLNRVVAQPTWLVMLANVAADVARVCGDRAITPLCSLLAGPKDWSSWAAELRRVGTTLSVFPCPEVSEALLPFVDHKALGPPVVEYLQRNPAEAVRALGPRLLESPKKAARANELLSAIARAEPEAFATAVSAEPQGPAQNALTKLMGVTAATSRGEDATLEELPRVLTSPPWRSKAARATVRVFPELAILPYEEHVERMELASKPTWFGAEGLLPAAEREKLDELLPGGARAADRPLGVFTNLYVPLDRLEPTRALGLWNETALGAFLSPFWAAGYLLREHGLAALPGTLRRGEAGDEPCLQALLACDTPRAARAMARALKRRSSRKLAIRWLTRFPRAAAVGLVPIGLGVVGRDRELASEALRWLVTNGQAEVVREVGRAYSPEIGAAVEEALSADPLQICPSKAPKLSAFFVAEALPRLALRNGKLVPIAEVTALGEMLQFSPIDPPYAGLADVKAALEPRSLDVFLWTLLGVWIDAGGSSANAWAMFALGHLGGDEVVRRLAPAIKRWPREKARPRALMGVDVLGMIGSDVALLHLSELAQRAKNVHVEDRARELLARVAENRGLDEEGLADRLVPDLGLDATGGLTLDFGPRSFRVRFSAELEPQVFEVGEASVTRSPLKTLPRATKDDDAAKAKAAHDLWKGLKEDAKSVTSSLRARLERAMCDGRTWEASSFRALMLEHPLVTTVARRLLWSTVEVAESGDTDAPSPSFKLLVTFRVAEDGSLADVNDASFELADDALVTLVHPLRLEATALARWTQLFGDYEVLQAFPQLAREVARPSNRTRSFTDLPTREIPYHVLAGSLESRGWKRCGHNEGSIDAYEKQVAGETATLTFSPPAYFREPPPERVTISGVSFQARASSANAPTLPEVDPVAYSEIERDLALVRPR